MALFRGVSSAPNKIILAGEHSVVWGGRAIVAAVEVDGKRNFVAAEFCGRKGLRMSGALGSASLAGGRLAGEKSYWPFLRGVSAALSSLRLEPKRGVRMRLDFSGAPKGTGNSASIAAASICSACGLLKRRLSPKKLFGLVMPVENECHAGKASGADPLAVCVGGAVMFKKKFSAKKASFVFKPVRLSLPSGTCLLLVDSHLGGPKASTGDLINSFAKSCGVACGPEELDRSTRRAITAPFDALVARISAQMRPRGDAKKLGGLFNENHALLRARGVSSAGIEKAVSIALSNGAYGAKLAGAGGNGGAVIVLAPASCAALASRLEKAGFAVRRMSFAAVGARLEKQPEVRCP